MDAGNITPSQFTTLLERMDAMRAELLARIDKLATIDALTALTGRVANIEHRMEEWPRRPADATRLDEMSGRVRRLEDAPGKADERRRSDIILACTVLGTAFAICSVCQWASGVGLSLVLHFLK